MKVSSIIFWVKICDCWFDHDYCFVDLDSMNYMLFGESTESTEIFFYILDKSTFYSHQSQNVLNKIKTISDYSNFQSYDATKVGKLGTVMGELTKQDVEMLPDDALAGAMLAGDLSNVKWSKRQVNKLSIWYFILLTVRKHNLQIELKDVDFTFVMHCNTRQERRTPCIYIEDVCI